MDHVEEDKKVIQDLLYCKFNGLQGCQTQTDVRAADLFLDRQKWSSGRSFKNIEHNLSKLTFTLINKMISLKILKLRSLRVAKDIQWRRQFDMAAQPHFLKGFVNAKS